MSMLLAKLYPPACRLRGRENPAGLRYLMDGALAERCGGGDCDWTGGRVLACRLMGV